MTDSFRVSVGFDGSMCYQVWVDCRRQSPSKKCRIRGPRRRANDLMSCSWWSTPRLVDSKASLVAGDVKVFLMVVDDHVLLVVVDIKALLV